MQVSHMVSAASAVFDDRNLIGQAGLVPVMLLAERAGLYDLLTDRLTVGSPNPVVKATCVVGGMVTGADTIDSLDGLRHGGMRRVFAGVRAPSTLGTFLRSFTFGHVRQLDAVNTRFLTALTGVVPGLLAGADQMSFIDVDDTIREVHGYAKQGAAYGYSGVKGVNAQIAAISTPVAAPVIGAARLRKGNVTSGHGGGQLVTDAVRTARRCGGTGHIMVRADSGYYQHKIIRAAVRAGVWFSVTARQDIKIRAAIASISDDGWTTIKYPRAVYDEATRAWVSDAEVAETPYVAFTSQPGKHHVPCRLIVRRVRAAGAATTTSTGTPTETGTGTSTKTSTETSSETVTATTDPGTGEALGEGQGELFPVWRYHAFVTNSNLTVVDADRTHRAHAIIEQVIAELKDGPLAHAPSGKFTANAAWLALAVTAFNLTRAAGVAASTRHATARCATIRRDLVTVPGRIATSARRIVIHLPTNWHWQTSLGNLLTAATGPPIPATT